MGTIFTRYGDGSPCEMSESDLMADLETGTADAAERGNIPALNKEELERYKVDIKAVLIIIDVLATLGVLMYGLMKLGWGYGELAGLFLVMSMIAAGIAGWTPNRWVDEFMVGVKTIVWGGLLTGVAKAIVVVMEDAHWVDDASTALMRRLAAAAAERHWAVVVTTRVLPDDGVLGEHVALGAIPDDELSSIAISATTAAPLRPHELDAIVDYVAYAFDAEEVWPTYSLSLRARTDNRLLWMTCFAVKKNAIMINIIEKDTKRNLSLAYLLLSHTKGKNKIKIGFKEP